MELTTFSEPKTAIDRLRQAGAHRWIRRKTKTRAGAPAQDLRGAERRGAARATVAGYEPATAPRFGAHVPAGEKLPATEG